MLRLIKTIQNLIKNLHFLGKYDLEEYISQKTSAQRIENIFLKMMIESYYSLNKDQIGFTSELKYLKDNADLDLIPYPKLRSISTKVFFDKSKQLPYVLHNNKPLFFPKEYKKEQILALYKSYMEKENITGKKYEGTAPHQYQMNDFCIESGDILLDIGCAEGLLALDTIELTKKVYLFEADPKWINALEATFSPYKNKVCIISKYVSDKNSDYETTLQSAINDSKDTHYFVKMDIEGAEEKVLIGNIDFLQSFSTKLACCTYHKKEHFETISNLLKKHDFTITSSDGYMLCFMDKNCTPPFFRKGLIRARNF